ncbi:hypothetical protein MKW98_020506, partial [Papaver atlanticum]
VMGLWPRATSSQLRRVLQVCYWKLQWLAEGPRGLLICSYSFCTSVLNLSA